MFEELVNTFLADQNTLIKGRSRIRQQLKATRTIWTIIWPLNKRIHMAPVILRTISSSDK